MERMNELLARAASRRTIRRRLQPAPDPDTCASGEHRGAMNHHGEDADALGHTRQPTSKSTSRSAGATSPRCPDVRADGRQLTQPTADVADVSHVSDSKAVNAMGDVLETDRILEIPSRPSSGYGVVHPAATQTQPANRPGPPPRR